MSLEKYRQKRDFGKTPEPPGPVRMPTAKRKKNLSFFIQEHHASHLHYDFRLELDGTLKSWAVPKGPSLDPAEKRLAVHVEDHPLEYGSFEGRIPAHEYGAGTVLLWDEGRWMPDGDPDEAYRRGRLKFTLAGKKLSGGWMLVRMGPAKGKKENWLLIKERDDAARTGKEANIVALRPESVAGGGPRTTAKKAGPAKTVTAVKTNVSNRRASRQSNTAANPASISPSGMKGAVKSPMPAQMEAQLASLAQHPPREGNWLSEIKFDGYRILCKVEQGNARLLTRAGNDWTTKWPSIADAVKTLPIRQAWFDGEVVAIAEDGSISFQLLQNMGQVDTAARVVYSIFDLLYLDGYNVSGVSLAERKQLLRNMLGSVDDNWPIRYTDHITGETQEIFSHACMHALEGIVVKRADAPYQAGRSRTWLKVKCRQRQEFVIGGFTDPEGKREKFGALLLGVYDQTGRLHYVGRVGTGFDNRKLQAISEAFPALRRSAPPFDDPPRGSAGRGVHWLEPALVAEVKFAEWTTDGLVRQASFIGLRTDKKSADITRETPLPETELQQIEQQVEQQAPHSEDHAPPYPDRTQADGKDACIAGVTLTHSSRILFPDIGLTKFDLAKYYADIKDWILPHLSQRPLTLVRCPNGGQKPCFFQRNVIDSIDENIDRIDVSSGVGKSVYMMANTLPALISMVQMGVLEIHTWGAQARQLDKPDRITFDLDPAPKLPWTNVIEGAQLLRAMLDDIGLRSFVKTTGGKGLHIVVPIQPERNWDEIKDFSRTLAEHMARTLPDRFTASVSKTRRTGKIFIDYLRNASEATAVVAFSTRARPGAPVSTPLDWDELSADVHSDSFTVINIRDRLAGLRKDPWVEYFTLRQKVTAGMLKIFQNTGKA